MQNGDFLTWFKRELKGVNIQREKTRAKLSLKIKVKSAFFMQMIFIAWQSIVEEYFRVH